MTRSKPMPGFNSELATTYSPKRKNLVNLHVLSTTLSRNMLNGLAHFLFVRTPKGGGGSSGDWPPKVESKGWSFLRQLLFFVLFSFEAHKLASYVPELAMCTGMLKLLVSNGLQILPRPDHAEAWKMSCTCFKGFGAYKSWLRLKAGASQMDLRLIHLAGLSSESREEDPLPHFTNLPDFKPDMF